MSVRRFRSEQRRKWPCPHSHSWRLSSFGKANLCLRRLAPAHSAQIGLAMLLCQPCTASPPSPEQAPQRWGHRWTQWYPGIHWPLGTGQSWDGMRKFCHRVGSPAGTSTQATSTFTCSAAQRPQSFCVLSRKKSYRNGRHQQLKLNTT